MKEKLRDGSGVCEDMMDLGRKYVGVWREEEPWEGEAILEYANGDYFNKTG